MKPAGLTSLLIVEWLEFRKRDGLSQRTIQRYYCAVKGFCGHLLDRGVLSSNPAAPLSLRHAEYRLPGFATPEQIDQLLVSINAPATTDPFAMPR